MNGKLVVVCGWMLAVGCQVDEPALAPLDLVDADVVVAEPTVEMNGPWLAPVVELEPVGWYLDLDGDGFGDPSTQVAEGGDGMVRQGGDCDDADPARSPAAEERCDRVDNDCDGHTDVEEGLCGPGAFEFDGSVYFFPPLCAAQDELIEVCGEVGYGLFLPEAEREVWAVLGEFRAIGGSGPLATGISSGGLCEGGTPEEVGGPSSRWWVWEADDARCTPWTGEAHTGSWEIGYPEGPNLGVVIDSGTGDWDYRVDGIGCGVCEGRVVE